MDFHTPFYFLKGIPMDLNLYTIDTSYVNFLRSDPKLSNVFENKDDTDSFLRKYLGVVLTIGQYNYYVPLSSPKNSDYLFINGAKKIRKSIIPIIRIVAEDVNGDLELKGTLKFSNMIPVPDTSITYYDISKEMDQDYKILVEKEYEFIRKHKHLILRNASVLYKQKVKEAELFPIGAKKPGYLSRVVDFKYAEQVYNTFISQL